MEFLSAMAGVIFDHAWATTGRHAGYLISYKRYISKLEKKFGELDALRNGVERRVDAARLERLEDVNSDVQTWLTDVGGMEEEVKRIKDQASLISNKHFLHIGSRYKLGREAAHHIKAINLLMERGNFPEVSHKPPPLSTTDALLVNDEDYIIFDSRKSRVKKILEALKDEAVHSIGIWGMGGVGKTTLVKDVAKQAKEQSLFGEVVMVTVSQNKDIKKIQTVIAEKMGLVLNEDTEEVRATKLVNRLKATKNKVLVILDDLWEPLHLLEVGIPLPQKVTTCKVVITTRNRDVCDRMSCKEIVELKKLSDEESWSLFRSRAGDAVESHTMGKLARNVASECAGLPLALVVLGAALKGKGPEIWKTVLKQLKMSMDVDLAGVSKQVFQSIKLSFDFLQSETAKSCFLHCCLYPEDSEIPKEELMHMMVGGRILVGDETLNNAQGRVDILLDLLKDRALLLQGSKENCVRMHDIVKDVAIQISAKDHAFYVRAGQPLAEWPRTVESEMRNYRRLSLMYTDIEHLPSDPMEYPKLEMLILRGNTRLSSIPEMFLLHMVSLMVLDLSLTGIKSLPESISCLTNLRVLNLRHCFELEDISYINGLKMLEILILEHVLGSLFPVGVEWAQTLRYVVLALLPRGESSFTNYFSKKLPRFPRLEYLFMRKFEGSIRELTSLTRLTHLHIMDWLDLDDSFLSQEELVSLDSWADQLLRFFLPYRQSDQEFINDIVRIRISIGDIHLRFLQLKAIKPLADWIKKLLEKTTQLSLVEFQETELISISSDIRPLSRLDYLQVVNWPKLTKLLGDELPFHEEIPLSQLQQMVIDNCPRLTELIPSRLCQQSMKKLRNLFVNNCPMMLELFPCDQEANDIIDFLPRLDYLKLNNGYRMYYNHSNAYQT